MNRAQRRAAQHARPKTDRNELTPARATAWARTIEQVRPYEPGEMVKEFVLIRAAFERLRTGHGTEPDFDLASMALNMALVRAEAIDPALVLIIVQGQQAFARMKARWLRGLPFGFDAQGLQDVPTAIDAFEAIVNASSPAQMAHSIRETYRRIRAQQIL
jgi:hypothetical protein